jgi:tetraacyldisaccharide 4'-kinase
LIAAVLEQRLTELWYRGGAAGWLLTPLAALYGAAVRLHRGAYAHGWMRSLRIRIPVIIVGNLTVGGTGKTPLVMWLVEQLAARGLRAAVLSRGYGRLAGAAGSKTPADPASAASESHEPDPPRVVRADSRWEDVGDEPLLIHRRTGCVTIVGRDRVNAARAAADFGFDLLVADDGLQHLPLARDCEIVVIDGARGFGTGRLLPAGPLREPVSRLKEVDLIVVNGEPEHPTLARLLSRSTVPVLSMSLTGGEALRVDGTGAARPLAKFADTPVHAVAGIGNPERFFRSLRAAGLRLIEHPFPDHHAFTAQELDFPEGYPILMTEKDAIRCRAFATRRTWFVPISAQLSGTDAAVLLERVERAFRARQALAR